MGFAEGFATLSGGWKMRNRYQFLEERCQMWAAAKQLTCHGRASGAVARRPRCLASISASPPRKQAYARDVGRLNLNGWRSSPRCKEEPQNPSFDYRIEVDELF